MFRCYFTEQLLHVYVILVLYDGTNFLGDVFDKDRCLIMLTTCICTNNTFDLYKNHLTTLLRARRTNDGSSTDITYPYNLVTMFFYYVCIAFL